MIIGIDGNEANNKERVGVHQYAHEILKAIHRLIADKNNEVRVIIYLKSAPLPDLPKENSYWKYVILGNSKFWVLTKLMLRLMARRECDIFFSPNHYLPFLTRTPKVCTIHDLGYLEFSGQFKKYDFWQLKYWTAISLNISKYIISVSESTKKDIVRQYNINPKKVNVVGHGYDKRRFHMDISTNDVRQAKHKYKIGSDYILYLGTLKPSKNVEGIISAFKKLKNDKDVSSDIKLIIGGKKGWLFEPIYVKIRDNEISNDVIFTGFVDEEYKPALMKGARVLISPSYWEGFGMHIVEAMACGVPVVVSDIDSIQEVVGEAGIYVDPYNIDSIYKGIKKVILSDKKSYNILVAGSLKQAGKFSWDKAAVKTLETLYKAIK